MPEVIIVTTDFFFMNKYRTYTDLDIPANG